jgi:Zn-dependent protease with chaperone function
MYQKQGVCVNFFKFLLLSVFVASSLLSANYYGTYYQEFKALKSNQATKELFDKDAHAILSTIQRDIDIFKNLTFFQRFIRNVFLNLDVIIVTPQILPKLYAYVERVCQKANIPVPTIFVTRGDGFFNAFAQKLFASTGGIVIGKKLMHDVSDDALEAVIAHEIGHIKYNHINKILALNAAIIFGGYIILRLLGIDGVISLSSNIKLSKHSEIDYLLKKQQIFFRSLLVLYLVAIIRSLIINKQFEKEADEFACKENGKSKGIIDFFELILKKEQLREEEFVVIYELLQKNKTELSFMDYYCGLIIRYYMAKFGHWYTKVCKNIYHNTFLGDHPSPEKRIEAAKQYMRCH